MASFSISVSLLELRESEINVRILNERTMSVSLRLQDAVISMTDFVCAQKTSYTDCIKSRRKSGYLLC